MSAIYKDILKVSGFIYEMDHVLEHYKGKDKKAVQVQSDLLLKMYMSGKMSSGEIEKATKSRIKYMLETVKHSKLDKEVLGKYLDDV